MFGMVKVIGFFFFLSCHLKYNYCIYLMLMLMCLVQAKKHEYVLGYRYGTAVRQFLEK
jgi:hypothetical protein